jgi:D-alanyl-D-alanine carboxypeptidase
MAVVHESLNFTCASGVQDHTTGVKMTVDDKIPEGSVTKPYTVMAILRLIDQGIMGFNDTIASHVDEILMKSNGTNLLGIWKGDAKINNVTLYELMHMKSGLADYDDNAMLSWTLKNPNKDFSPIDYLYTLNKKWICDPGTCVYYSSVGMSLLTFAAA